MKSRAKAPTVPVLLTPWIDCLSCFGRAYLNPCWRPKKGLNQKLRKFTCRDGHDTYTVFTPEKLVDSQLSPSLEMSLVRHLCHLFTIGVPGNERKQ